jgi:hypothetical protein
MIQFGDSLETREYGFVWVKNLQLKESTVFASVSIGKIIETGIEYLRSVTDHRSSPTAIGHRLISVAKL